VAASASAVVFTWDYSQITVLPALTGTPGDKDWRQVGAVTPVKNEGQCDTSWAFAVTGLVEADHKIRTAGALFSLSEQELLDCTPAPSGCGGGSPVAALETLVAKGGLAASASYPYTARQGTCKTFTPVATIPGAGRVPPGDEVSLQNYVARGPVLALVDASPAFNSYKGGIFNGPCGANPTQAVLIVGYVGNSGSGDYWIVKNSLGASWGSQGYIYMARHQNLCGIANFALAVSNDPLPPPPRPAAPTPILGAWGVGFLLLGLAAAGVLRLRG
jgi:C1A family cysteine protease